MKRKASAEVSSPTMTALRPALAPEVPHIPYDRMRQQEEVRVTDDDWTGITDPKLRRKLQNRLNQRAKRKREMMRASQHTPLDEDSDTTAGLLSNPEKDTQSSALLVPRQATIIDRFQKNPPTRPSLWLPKLSGMKPEEAVALIRSYEAWVQSRQHLPCPSSDLLLSLVQYNVFRAMILNTFTLGLTMEWMEDDAISPFCGSYATRPESLYPSSLRPTALQKKVEHHPWIDLFPHARMRDNLLQRLDTYDEDLLCEDIVGWHSGPLSTCGVIIWQDPWSSSGWEISETFARAWPWVVAGCTELMHSTNYWRSRRGEKPLRFEEVS